MGNSFSKQIAYDAARHKWQVSGIECPYRRTWWRLVLANTVYNPWVTVTVLWRKPTEYSLDELKLAYVKAVDKDDDILTQFVEADELKNRILAAQTFNQVVEVYKWMETDQSDDQAA